MGHLSWRSAPCISRYSLDIVGLHDNQAAEHGCRFRRHFYHEPGWRLSLLSLFLYSPLHFVLDHLRDSIGGELSTAEWTKRMRLFQTSTLMCNANLFWIAFTPRETPEGIPRDRTNDGLETKQMARNEDLPDGQDDEYKQLMCEFWETTLERAKRFAEGLAPGTQAQGPSFANS